MFNLNRRLRKWEYNPMVKLRVRYKSNQKKQGDDLHRLKRDRDERLGSLVTLKGFS